MPHTHTLEDRHPAVNILNTKRLVGAWPGGGEGIYGLWIFFLLGQEKKEGISFCFLGSVGGRAGDGRGCAVKVGSGEWGVEGVGRRRRGERRKREEKGSEARLSVR